MLRRSYSSRRGNKNLVNRITKSLKPCVEPLEMRRLLVASVYVGENSPTDFLITNDVAPPGLSNGDTVTWNPGGGQHTAGEVSGLIFGVDAFTSVVTATTLVDISGTVFVEAGTYNELVTVPKRVTYLGAQAGVDARTRGAVPEAIMNGNAGSSSFNVTASNVRIDGFTVQNQTNVNQFGAGIVLGAATSGASIRNNIVQNNVAGLFASNTSAVDQLIINQNLFRNNNNPGSATGNAIYGDQFTNGGTINNVLIRDNRFTGNNVSSGVNLTQGNNVAIDDNAFESGNALFFNNVDNSSITDNQFTGQLAVPPASFQIVGVNVRSGSDTVLVDGNSFTNRLAGAISISLGNSNLTITDNTITQDVTAFSAATRNMVLLTRMAGTNSFSRNTITLSGTLNAGGNFHGVEVSGNGTAGNTGTVNVTQNVLNGGNVDAGTTNADSSGLKIFGSAAAAAVINVTQNKVNDWVNGVVGENIQSVGSFPTITISNNDLSGNSSKGWVRGPVGTFGVVNASSNWWGSTTLATVTSYASGTSGIDFTPYLNLGTDTSGDAGFQGDFSSLTVHANGGQVGSTGRITEGVTLLANGSLTGANRVINVVAGTYADEVNINKSLRLLGEQVGVDARGRVAPESIITSPFADLTTALLTVTADDVTLDGLTLDGNNASIAGGVAVVGGTDSNARRGTHVIGSENVIFQNNRVLSLYGRGVQYQDTAPTVISTGTVTRSVFDNIGDLAQADGFALLAFDSTVNFTNNNVTDANFGPWYQFIYTGKGTIGVSGNNVAVQGIGIGLNETGGNAGAITVANNTFTVASVGPGAQVWSVANTGGAAFNGNAFTGSGGAGSTGVYAWTGTGAMSVPFNGGSISGFETGVEVINEELTGPFGPATAPANITLNGVALTAAPGGTAVRVIDTPAGDQTASVTLVGGTTITGSSSGIGVHLDGALAQLGGDSLGNTSFTGFTGTSQFVELDNGAYAGDEIDGTGATYNGTPGGAGVTNAQGFAIEDRITHVIDGGGVGLVRVKPGHVFVTSNSASIQRGVDAADEGDTVNVAAGTYPESVTIPKGVTIDGEGNGPTPLVTWTSNSSNPLANITTTDATDDVTFLDIAFDGTNGANTAGTAINAVSPAANFDALTVDRSTFTDFSFHGINVDGDATNGIAPRNVVVSNSSFTGNGTSGQGGSGDISLFEYNGNASFTNLTHVGTATATTGGGRFGIQLRGVGAANGAGLLPMGTVAFNDVDISGNYGTHFIGLQRYANVNNLSLVDVELGGATSNITRTFGALLRFDTVGAGTVAGPALADLGNTYFRGLSSTSPVPFFLEFAPDNTFAFLLADAKDTRWNLSSGTGVVASAMTLPQAFEATDRILDYADQDAGPNPFKGWAELQDGKAFNTPNSSNINHTVDVVDPNGTIFVKEGTYTQLVSVDRSVTLKGAQAGVDPRPGRPGPETIMNNPGGSFDVSANNVVIDGFTIRDATAPVLGTGIYFRSTSSGYQLLNNIITQNIFGIYLNSQGMNPTVVRHNLFNANNQPGAASGNGIYADQGSRNVLVEENRFTGHTNAAMVFAGLLGTQSDITVDDNQFVNDDSIVFFNTNNVDITNNTSTGSNGSMIALGGGNNGVTITGNTASAAPTQAGVSLPNPAPFGATANSDVTIVNNSFTGLLNGIRASTGSTSNPVLIQGNTLNANTNGVRVDGGNVSITADNNIAINAGAGVLVETGGIALINGNDTTGIHDNLVGIDVNGGTATISNNVINDNTTGIHVRGNGTATLTSNQFNGNDLGLNVDSGSATVTNTQRIDGVEIDNAGTATLTEGNNVVLVTTRLTTFGSGRLDMRDNAAIVDYSGASPVSSIFTRLQSGYAGGAWTGPGIMSQTAANDPNQRTAVGFAEATDLFSSFPAMFEGQSIDSTSILLKYTLYGDCTLDRKVDITDFALLSANFNQSPRRWSQGDFNYNATVDIGDFAFLSANFNVVLQAPASAASVSLGGRHAGLFAVAPPISQEPLIDEELI